MKYCPVCGVKAASGDACPNDGAVLIDAPTEVELIGEVLKETFRVEERIAAGGMGVVFRGTQVSLGRTVAIKTLLPGLERDPSLVQRFFREARILSQFQHPNIVQVFDCGNTDAGVFYLVMEYIDGKTLQEHVPADRGLPFDELMGLFSDICAGVEEAHTHDLVHRDLKPSNVLLAAQADGHLVAKVVDFGLARPRESDETQLTRAGLALGTPGYSAPEQFAGEGELDARSDVYSLGAILFFAAAGRSAYDGATSSSIIARQLNEAPDVFDTAQVRLPSGLREVVLRAMERDPARRYSSAAQLERAVRALADNQDATAAPDTTLTEIATVAAPMPPPVGPARAMVSRRALIGGAGLAAGAGALGWAAGWFSPGSREPLRFGMSAALSGPAAELGRGMRTGIEARFLAAADADVLGGRGFELVALDDGYEPDRTTANMLALAADEHLLAVVGNVGTPTAEVAVPIAIEHGLPFIGAFTGADLLRRIPPDRYVFNYRASYEQETAAIVDYFVKVQRIDPDRIAIMTQNDGYGDSGANGVFHQLRQLGYYDTEAVVRVGYERNTMAVEAAVDAITEQRERIDAIVMVATYHPAARFVRMLRQRGVDPVFANVSFVGSRALEEEFRQYGAGSGEGVIVTQVVPHPESSATAVIEYREHLARHHPSSEPGFVSLEGYVVASLLIEALELAGPDVTRESLVAAFESLERLDLGLGTALSFGPSDHQASDMVWGTEMDANNELVPIELA